MPKRRPWSAPVLALALLLAGCASMAPAGHEPRNLGLLKEEIYAYVDSGRYNADLTAVSAEAIAWIGQRAAQAKPGEKLALVFDIDETALSNLPHMRHLDFGTEPHDWEDWVREAACPPIEPVREIHRAALSRGVAIFFVTARWEGDRAATEKNLRSAGYDGYTALYCAPDGFDGAMTETFKTSLRKQITGQGYTIIANIGDQMSDLNGGYAERTFKLADPFYLIK
jgi:predicted secreted acid phosphatase